WINQPNRAFLQKVKIWFNIQRNGKWCCRDIIFYTHDTIYTQRELRFRVGAFHNSLALIINPGPYDCLMSKTPYTTSKSIEPRKILRQRSMILIKSNHPEASRFRIALYAEDSFYSPVICQRIAVTKTGSTSKTSTQSMLAIQLRP